MKFGATANPQQVETMWHVVDAYCKHLGIDPETPEEKQIALVVLELYQAGLRGQNELLHALIIPNHRSLS